VVVVFLIAVSSQLDNFNTCHDAVDTDVDSPWLTRLICRVVISTKKGFFTGQVPTVLLLSFNSLVLPYWIDLICQRMICYTITRCELNQLALNLVVLVLSKFVVPFVSLAVLSLATQEDDTSLNQESTLVRLVDLPRSAMQDAGVFYLKYSLNCAFFTTSFGLLQIGRHIYRALLLSFSARTYTERKQADACLAFPWGYWYAWSLSLAANGLITGVTVPSMLPVTALTFALKYYVDQRLLEEEKVFNPGPDTKGFFPPYIAHYMYNIIAVKVFFMAILAFLWARHSRAAWKGDTDGLLGIAREGVYVDLASLSLFLMSLVLFLGSSWSKLQFRLNANCAPDQETCVQKAAAAAVFLWDKLLLKFREVQGLRRGNSRSPLKKPLMDESSRMSDVERQSLEPGRPSSVHSLPTSSLDTEALIRGLNKDLHSGGPKVISWDARKNLLNEVLADKWENFIGIEEMDSTLDRDLTPIPGEDSQASPRLVLNPRKRALRKRLCEIFGEEGENQMGRKQCTMKRKQNARTGEGSEEVSFLVPSPRPRQRATSVPSVSGSQQASQAPTPMAQSSGYLRESGLFISDATTPPGQVSTPSPNSRQQLQVSIAPEGSAPQAQASSPAISGDGGLAADAAMGSSLSSESVPAEPAANATLSESKRQSVADETAVHSAELALTAMFFKEKRNPAPEKVEDWSGSDAEAVVHDSGPQAAASESQAKAPSPPQHQRSPPRSPLQQFVPQDVLRQRSPIAPARQLQLLEEEKEEPEVVQPEPDHHLTAGGQNVETGGNTLAASWMQDAAEASEALRHQLALSEEPLPVVAEGELEESRTSAELDSTPAARVGSTALPPDFEEADPFPSLCPSVSSPRVQAMEAVGSSSQPLLPSHHPILSSSGAVRNLTENAAPALSVVVVNGHGTGRAGDASDATAQMEVSSPRPPEFGSPRTPVTPVLTPASSVAPSSVGAQSLPEPAGRALMVRRGPRGTGQPGMSRMRSVPNVRGAAPGSASMLTVSALTSPTKARRRSKEAEDIPPVLRHSRG